MKRTQADTASMKKTYSESTCGQAPPNAGVAKSLTPAIHRQTWAIRRVYCVLNSNGQTAVFADAFRCIVVRCCWRLSGHGRAQKDFIILLFPLFANKIHRLHNNTFGRAHAFRTGKIYLFGNCSLLHALALFVLLSLARLLLPLLLLMMLPIVWPLLS